MAAALVVVVVLLPGNDRLWHRLHGAPAGESWFDEDATMVAAITQTEPTSEQLAFKVNGKGHSWLPFGDLHSQLGVVPALVHPEPKQIAIIGLGSGDTAWAAACRASTESVTVFELGSPQPRLLARLAGTSRSLPGLRSLLADARISVVTADGRNALTRDDRRYDLIEADALRPHSAFSGNLYSVEFFRLCQERLKPGGIMCTWQPTPRIGRTFCAAFPHVIAFERGNLLIGSREPLPIDLDTWRQRLASERVAAYFDDDTRALSEQVLAGARRVTAADFGAGGSNRDLFPRDEFSSPERRPQ
jgi:hypothetical protein